MEAIHLSSIVFYSVFAAVYVPSTRECQIYNLSYLCKYIHIVFSVFNKHVLIYCLFLSQLRLYVDIKQISIFPIPSLQISPKGLVAITDSKQVAQLIIINNLSAQKNTFKSIYLKSRNPRCQSLRSSSTNPEVTDSNTLLHPQI